MQKISLVVFIILLGGILNAQELNQTVRGRIIDQDNRATIPGANVVVLNSNPILGASTNVNGEFKIENVPVGRVDLKITFLGYEEKVIPSIVVSSGKEVVLDIELTESLVNLDAVEITGTANKAEVINEMALISARTFSVDETKRYAGAVNDPARMVSAFAGVTGDAQGDNNIVVRGNSSKGILWRLEGVDIPNPNHFADEGSTGGPINALNSSMLANSDFFTGAFAPEYGNATSGIFDMKLRKGNNEKREYSLTAGIFGVEAAIEGPFSKNGNSSYLFNYRYSSLAILDDAGIVDFGGVPKYQDASFKCHFPTKKLGTFTLFGLGGLSKITQSENDSLDNPLYSSDYNANLGTIGLNQVIAVTNNIYFKNSISVSENGSGTEYFEQNNNEDLKLYYKGFLQKVATRGASTMNVKLNARHKLQVGGIYTHYNYNFTSKYHDDELNKLITELEEDGNAGLLQNFVSWKYRITEDITMVSGVHYLHFMLNNSNSIEPRAALKWKFAPTQAINAGFGVHSRLESMTAYFAKSTDENGTVTTPNKNLSLGKANHYVLGYENLLTENLLFKAELYCQQLYNVPVENDSSSNFSILNTNGWFTDRNLVNKGTGTNYGVEFTLERYFNKGFYYLATASFYESKYTPLNGKERDTRYNGNYVGNFLFGKEFKVGSNDKNKVIGTSAKILYLGGLKYTPIDREASEIAGQEVTHEKDVWTAKGEDVFQANVVVYYRSDRKKTSHEIKLDIMNVTNNDAIVDEYYDSYNKEVVYSRQLSMIPAIYYKVDF